MGGELPTAAKGLLWPVILLALGGWIVALVGLATLQRQCPTAGGPGLFGVGNQLPFSLRCRDVYRFHWWILFFEFPILLGIIATVLMGRIWALRTSWLALLAVCTALYMYSTNVMLNLVSNYNGPDHGPKRARVAFSGFLIVSFANCLLLFILGMERDNHRDVAYNGAEYGTATTGTHQTGGGMFGRKRGAADTATAPGTHPVGTHHTGAGVPPAPVTAV